MDYLQLSLLRQTKHFFLSESELFERKRELEQSELDFAVFMLLSASDSDRDRRARLRFSRDSFKLFRYFLIFLIVVLAAKLSNSGLFDRCGSRKG